LLVTNRSSALSPILSNSFRMPSGRQRLFRPQTGRAVCGPPRPEPKIQARTFGVRSDRHRPDRSSAVDVPGGSEQARSSEHLATTHQIGLCRPRQATARRVSVSLQVNRCAISPTQRIGLRLEPVSRPIVNSSGGAAGVLTQEDQIVDFSYCLGGRG